MSRTSWKPDDEREGRHREEVAAPVLRRDADEQGELEDAVPEEDREPGAQAKSRRRRRRRTAGCGTRPGGTGPSRRASAGTRTAGTPRPSRRAGRGRRRSCRSGPRRRAKYSEEAGRDEREPGPRAPLALPREGDGERRGEHQARDARQRREPGRERGAAVARLLEEEDRSERQGDREGFGRAGRSDRGASAAGRKRKTSDRNSGDGQPPDVAREAVEEDGRGAEARTETSSSAGS